MENTINQGEQPDANAQKVIDSLKEQGHTFEGLDPKEPEKAPEPKQDPINESKESPKEPGKEEEPKESEEPATRQARKEAWQVGMDARRKRQELKKDSEEKENLLLNEIKGLHEKIEQIGKGKQEAPAKSIEEQAEEIAQQLEEGKIDLKTYNKAMVKLLKSEPAKADVPDELKQKLSELEALKSDWESKKQKELEDLRFDKDFNEKIVLQIKKDFPDASLEDILAIKGKLNELYFTDKYINYDIGDIYQLKNGELAKNINQAPPRSIETGKRGVGRTADRTFDYENITEEEFAKLPHEEKMKVVEYKTKNAPSRL